MPDQIVIKPRIFQRNFELPAGHTRYVIRNRANYRVQISEEMPRGSKIPIIASISQVDSDLVIEFYAKWSDRTKVMVRLSR